MFLAILSALMVVLIVQITTGIALEGKLNMVAATAIMCIFLALCVPTFLFLTDPSDIRFLIYAISLLFSLLSPIFLFRNIKKSHCLYIATLTLGLILTLSSSFLWIASTTPVRLLDPRLIDLFTNTILLIICILMRGILSQFLRNIMQVAKNMQILLLSSVWIAALLSSMFSILFNDYSYLPGLTFSGLLTAASIILNGIMCPLLIVNMLSKTYYKNLSDVMDKQVQAQVSHYMMMSKMNDDIRLIRHDFKNLRLGMIDSLRRNDLAGALVLLNATETSKYEMIFAIDTGNAMLDALLRDKQVSAVEVNASIEFDGGIPSDLLDASEICIIFGNAVDNAVEACENCPGNDKKVIQIQSVFSNGFLFIRITNPTAKDIQIVNNTVETSKKNKRSHGIGLRSILTVVEKHSGKMTLTFKNNIFCVEIDLDCHR